MAQEKKIGFRFALRQGALEIEGSGIKTAAEIAKEIDGKIMQMRA